jgi:hypothetical protein
MHVMIILASDFTGFFEALLWWAVNGFYSVMLLITGISLIGRKGTKANDDLTHSLVLGGIVLLLTLALFAWQLLGRTHPEWVEFRFFAIVSASLWSLALLLRWYQRR